MDGLFVFMLGLIVVCIADRFRFRRLEKRIDHLQALFETSEKASILRWKTEQLLNPTKEPSI